MGEWVPHSPGSELAFCLGMINVMLYEIGLAKLDVNFLKRRSNAPYLIGAGERYVRDPDTKKPMIWDPTDNKAKVFDDPTIKDYALEGELSVAVDRRYVPGLRRSKLRSSPTRPNGLNPSRPFRRLPSGALRMNSWPRPGWAARSRWTGWNFRCARPCSGQSAAVLTNKTAVT